MSKDSQKKGAPLPYSWLEATWLGYQAFGSTVVGLANLTLPMAVMHSAVTSRGGGSIPKLFDTTIKALETAESAPPPEPPKPAPAAAAPSLPKSGLASIPNLSAAVTPSTPAPTPETLALERLTNARENLDTLAALVATTLFHIQYAVGGDALATFLAVHALRPSTPDNERRLVHKAMGVLKLAQYGIYILHESFSADGLEVGAGTLINLFGLGLGLAASYTWGWKKKDVVKKN
ncbi:hypothetical protein HDU96_002215 [Phlyctochytrium bullatum]|nr:hypothetical protein HDU96_002215 [Phlyctochytrium bullatum]